MFTQDLFERLSGCPFYPFGTTALSVRGGKEARELRGEIKEKMKGDGIYVGIKRSEWTHQRQSMLRTLEKSLHYKVTEHDKGFVVEDDRGGPPIYATVFKRTYKFFKNPDITFWGVTEFLMPNPFEDYWKARNFVQ